jgi:hypothetical protein
MVHFWPSHPNCQLRFTIISSDLSDTRCLSPSFSATRTENTILVRREVVFAKGQAGSLGLAAARHVVAAQLHIQALTRQTQHFSR